MLPNKEKKIVLPTTTEGVFEITITSKDNKTVFTDCISSKNKKIILKGFSKHLYNVTLVPILINQPF
ncbi:hypothetical protein [Flavobacterium sp.]|uniref:hypothetical protein n=1 Tax=Flavobacterium sp. TaxID=239 RepID=UPI002B4B24B7|nr:hypothetical protein [Flavobacterium sp.]HLP62910.1 hypothetical protein [Flavobacterium sp.]